MRTVRTTGEMTLLPTGQPGRSLKAGYLLQRKDEGNIEDGANPLQGS